MCFTTILLTNSPSNNEDRAQDKASNKSTIHDLKMTERGLVGLSGPLENLVGTFQIDPSG